jgi:curli biogenesis system outer membrane secretion channel CsgG
MPRALRLVVLTLSVAALSACASVDVQSTEYVAAPRYQPTDAKSVQILRTEPKVPHDRLGEVVVDASTDPPPPVVEIEQKLCQAAAKMGANAVVIVLDRVQPVAAYVTGPYWGRSIESVSGRKVIGIAIRFRQ